MMADLRELFRTLDRLDAPDLWPEAQRRRPGTVRFHRRPSRFIAAAVAFALAIPATVLVVRAFGGSTARRNPKSAISVPHGAIAFVRSTGPSVDAAREIYLVEPDGSGARRLTDAGAKGMVAAEPAWSPDGTRIAFVVSTPEHIGAYAGDGDIFVMKADGTGVTRLTEGLRDADPAWSPDGTRIVLVRDQGTMLVVMSADGSGVSELRLDGEAYPPYQSPAWSPDETRIAFQASSGPGVDTNSVYMTNVDGTGATRITHGGADGTPAWSPDGATLAYAGPDGIYLLDVATGSAQHLTDCRHGADCGRDFAPSWSPDASRIAFSRHDGAGTTVQVFVVNTDGTGLQQLTNGPNWNGDPSWQPVPVEATSPSPRSSVDRCIQAKATGDFDGDGRVDTAGFVEVVPAGVACEQEGGVVAHLTSQEIVIRFGSGPTLVQPFSDCEGGACANVFTATDLDGDGRDELAIDVGPGAAVAFVEFYRVDREGIRPLVIAAPGDPPYVKPGPAILGGGFDSGLQSPILCEVNADGSREIVSVHAENTSDRVTGQWRVHTTNMLLNGDQLRVRSVGDADRTFHLHPEAFRNDCP
jgi:Tol biopolymer transport system component